MSSSNNFDTTSCCVKRGLKKRAADVTFAVIGRGEVGEFPQQPSLVGVPAKADNREKQSVRLTICSIQPAAIKVQLKLANSADESLVVF